jgi:ribosomal protein L10
MPTPQKEAVLKDTTQRIASVRGIYLADFTGMTVASLSLLRKRCREQGIQFRVIKNTLLKRSFNERGISELDPFLIGPTGLVFSSDNEMAPAKVLSDFAKEFEKPRIKAAVVDGRLYVRRPDDHVPGCRQCTARHAGEHGGRAWSREVQSFLIPILTPGPARS